MCSENCTTRQLLANDRSVCSVLAAVVASLAIYSGTASMLGANLQQNTSGSSLEPVSGAPVISATPEHVTLTNGNGSTQIQWNTGKGSSGFVFVTEDGAKPVLFAKGPRGSHVAPWIRKHRYIFELYGDDQRQTLLAKVIVSGSAESVSSQQHGVVGRCSEMGTDSGISSGFVFRGLSQFDGTAANDISNGANYVASAAPCGTQSFPRNRCLRLRRMASSFTPDCMSRSWLQIHTQDVSRKPREPQRSAFHRV